VFVVLAVIEEEEDEAGGKIVLRRIEAWRG
jgi:hypothetical protein